MRLIITCLLFASIELDAEEITTYLEARDKYRKRMILFETTNKISFDRLLRVKLEQNNKIDYNNLFEAILSTKYGII